MMAAIAAAYQGHEVHVFEKNEKLGKKLYITGKGRCNLTNNSDREIHFQNIIRNPKFLYSAYHCMDAQAVCAMFEAAKTALKTERGNRVFPVSDKSSDIIRALTDLMKEAGVQIHTNTEIQSISVSENKVFLEDNRRRTHEGGKVIVATGGLSYPVTGSTGDGYRFAQKLGHTIEETSPSLVPFHISGELCKKMQGLSLKNVSLKIIDENGKEYYKEQGEMLFTHFGMSGPLVLSASSFISGQLKKHRFWAVIDLKPALTFEELDLRLLRDFEMFSNKNFQNALDRLLPKKMIPVIVGLTGISPFKKVHEITKKERLALVRLLKELKFSIAGLRGYNEAIITKGGVSTKEINPKTMESKLCPNVYFVGEVIDVDALTGGFNLQIAWSTGYLAGSSID